jgi:hypothetical protein
MSMATTSSVPIPGWRLCHAAGFVPLLAGIIVILTNWLNVARADSPWWTGVGTLGFTYHGLAAAGAGAAPYVALTGSVGGVNVVGAAIAVIVVARYGLKSGSGGPGGSSPSAWSGSVCTTRSWRRASSQRRASRSWSCPSPTPR